MICYDKHLRWSPHFRSWSDFSSFNLRSSLGLLGSAGCYLASDSSQNLRKLQSCALGYIFLSHYPLWANYFSKENTLKMWNKPYIPSEEYITEITTMYWWKVCNSQELIRIWGGQKRRKLILGSKLTKRMKPSYP